MLALYTPSYIHKANISQQASTTFNPSVPVVEINYNDSNSMKQILDDHKVDVVISAIILSTSETSKAQLNLIAAASESSTVNRFIPSEYGIDNTPEYAHPPFSKIITSYI